MKLEHKTPKGTISARRYRNPEDGIALDLPDSSVIACLEYNWEEDKIVLLVNESAVKDNAIEIRCVDKIS